MRLLFRSVCIILASPFEPFIIDVSLILGWILVSILMFDWYLFRSRTQPAKPSKPLFYIEFVCFYIVVKHAVLLCSWSFSIPVVALFFDVCLASISIPFRKHFGNIWCVFAIVFRMSVRIYVVSFGTQMAPKDRYAPPPFLICFASLFRTLLPLTWERPTSIKQLKSFSALVPFTLVRPASGALHFLPFRRKTNQRKIQ